MSSPAAAATQPSQHPAVNSRTWWNDYFRDHWEANTGREQTRHFMVRLAASIPSPVREWMERDERRVLDWGCALGEGVEELRRAFPRAAVEGLDFSESAIRRGRELYPGVALSTTQEFEARSPDDQRFDVVVCSNCLEHFADPIAKMREQLRLCAGVYIAMVPLEEPFPLCESHAVSLAASDFPEQVDHFRRLCAMPIDVDPRYWPLGKQLLVVYVSADWTPVALGLRDDPLRRSRLAAEASPGERAPHDVAPQREIDPSRRAERDKWDSIYAAQAESIETPASSRTNREFAELVSALLPEGGRTLEAGCGEGRQSLALAQRGFNVELLDFSAEAIATARRIFSQAGVGASFHVADAFEHATPAYDIVFNAGVLEHYTREQQIALMRAMASRSRGYVLLLVPSRLCYWYWVWRTQLASTGGWPYGVEMPVADTAELFREAGLEPVGTAFLGASWTTTFIEQIDGLSPDLRRRLLRLHESGVVDDPSRSYLVACLAKVPGAPVRPAPEAFVPTARTSEHELARVRANLADAVSESLGKDAQVSLAARREADLRTSLQEAQGQLDRIRGSKVWKVLRAGKAVLRRFTRLSATGELRLSYASLVNATLGWPLRLVLPSSVRAVVRTHHHDAMATVSGTVVCVSDPAGLGIPGHATLDSRGTRKRRVRFAVLAAAPADQPLLLRWIDGLARQTRRPDEVVVANCAPAAVDLEVAGAHASSLGLALRFVGGPGLTRAAALNEALRTTSQEYVVLADASLELSGGYLEKLICPLERSDEIDAVAPRHTDDSALDLAQDADWNEVQAHVPPSVGGYAIKASIARKVGGLVDHLSRGGEEGLLALNASGVGARWAYAPEAVVQTLRPPSRGARLRAAWIHAFGSGESRVRFHTYAGHARALLMLALMLVTGGLIAAGLAVLSLRPEPLLSPVIAGLVFCFLAAGVLLYAARSGPGRVLLRSVRRARSPGESAAALVERHFLTPVAESLGFLSGLASSRGDALRRAIDLTRPTIVFTPGAEWHWMKQRPTHLAEAFAKRGIQVVFCPNNYLERVYGNFTRVGGDAQGRGAVILCNDHDALRGLERCFAYVFSAKAFRGELGFLPRGAKMIFDYIDESKISGSTDDDVARAARRADLTCVTARRLLEHLHSIGITDPLLVPNAVHVEDWTKAPASETPEDLASVLRAGKYDAVVGYVGALSYWFDYETVRAAAIARPNYLFVLIGPILTEQAGVSVRSMPTNVVHLGTKSYSDLPAYLRAFHVATVPFLLMDVTLSTSPVKMFEYAAAGVPIVSSPLPECVACGPIVRTPSSVGEWLSALDAAIAERGDEAKRDMLRSFARANTWDARADAILSRMGLGPEPAARG